MRSLILAGLIAAAFAPAALAAKPAKPAKTAAPAAKLDIAVRDLSPKFVEFYQVASEPVKTEPGKPVENEADVRWRYFKQGYDFSVHQDEAAARAAFEQAWPRYPAVMKQIEGGFDAMTPKVDQMLSTLADQYYFTKPLTLRFVSYVGTFEGRVWSEQDGDRTNIYLPLETGPETRALPLARLLSRMMLDKELPWPNGRPRNLAEQIIAEGVLAHGLSAAVPGQPDEAYLDLPAAKLAELKQNKPQVLRSIIPLLKSGADDTLATYRSDKLAEARYAGWMLVKGFRGSQKAQLADLIRQNPNDLVRASELMLAGLAKSK
ncbi:hypothetical protein [Chitinimonas lacunae]|uniref:HEAT repeat domain-containing protein n=1 Tax=Chitinimonas lacunae TaxID=1963018 RepID=A0ABV8MLJ8_9NEIS